MADSIENSVYIHTDKFWKEFVGNAEHVKRYLPLVERWLHEKKYEDIKDYLPIIRKIFLDYFPESSVVKMYKHPFGFMVHVRGGELAIKFAIKNANYDIYADIKKNCTF
jgi:hypothetical protein